MPERLSRRSLGVDRTGPHGRKAAHPSVSGHEGNYALREMVNAIRYQGRTGVQWDCLPHDLPPKGATYYSGACSRVSRRSRSQVPGSGLRQMARRRHR
ncbi:transposase [Nonomuraea bangladeshensis]|uniref:transposase n=1 Tax=Nonomuraea bangladeshensis TaxID=404385 RepID=UPI003C2E81ED